MKKIFLYAIGAALVALALPNSAFAGCISSGAAGTPGGPFSLICFPESNSLVEIIAFITRTLISLAGILAVLFLIIGGIRYIISLGNSDQVEAARHTIVNAIIGLIVIALSYVILNTIISIFT